MFRRRASEQRFYTFTNNIFLQDLVSGFSCGGPGEPCDSNNSPYYRPGNGVTRQQMAKFIDNARHLPGISIDTNSLGPLQVRNTASSTFAVSGLSVGTDGYGIFGESNNSTGNYGVYGTSVSGTGVGGVGHIYGVYGRGIDTAPGVFGHASTGPGMNGESTVAMAWLALVKA